MNSIFKSIFLLFIPLLTFSQVNYFNSRFDYNITGMWDNSRSLLEVEDGYIIGGMTGGANIFWYYLAIRKIDYQGNEVWTKTWGEADKQYWIGEPGSLIKTSDNGYLMCGTYKDNLVTIDAALLVKFDENFDTLWTRKRSDTISPSNYFYYYFQCKEIPEEGYIITGVKKPAGEASKIHLVKTDYFGNIKWEKVYGTGNYYYQTFSIVITTDGGFAIGGYRFIIGQNETADPIIYKTDSLGNLEWEKNIGGPYDDNYPMLTLGYDGNILAGFTYADSMAQPDVAYRRINIVKLDNQGNEIWDKKYGQTITFNYLTQIRTTSNGVYIAKGNVKTDYPHRAGWLLRINENGDSLWYRQYDNLLGDDSRNFLYDVIPTSDNGFVACGYVIPYPPDQGSQDAWVLKVDSMGCDTPGCATGVQVFDIPAGDQQELRVWPNPTNGLFQVSSSRFQVGGPEIIRVYNSQGVKVKEMEMPEKKVSVEVDISDNHKGLFYVQLIFSNQTMHTQKIIKN